MNLTPSPLIILLNNTPENVINSNYYDTDQLQTLKKLACEDFKDYL